MTKKKSTTTTTEKPKTTNTDGKDHNTPHGRGRVRGKGKGQERGQDQYANQKRNASGYNITATKFERKSIELKFNDVTLTANGSVKQEKDV